MSQPASGDDPAAAAAAAGAAVAAGAAESTSFAPRGVDPHEVVRLLSLHDVGGWGVLATSEDQAAYVTWEESSETEWHQVLMLTCARADVTHARLVVHVPSWRGATLESKVLASAAASRIGVGPALLADLWAEAAAGSGARSRVLVSEFLEGGTLQAADFVNGETMAAVGRLYGRFHTAVPHAWFDDVLPGLLQEGAFQLGDAGSSGGATPGDWASCLWILSWLLRQVPERNRAQLAALGVDFAFLAAEIAGLPSNPVLPRRGPLARTVLVHGDSHGGNVMRAGIGGELRLIDFDMTARGPAGSEFGFLTLMLFRCGFAPEAVVPLEVQRSFAAGYLEAISSDGAEVDGALSVDDLLFDMHCWAYTGLLKMGLLCAVLMENDGHAAKREVMRRRGPTLLHPGFLSAAKSIVARAAAGDLAVREALVTKGLFFTAEADWKSRVGA